MSAETLAIALNHSRATGTAKLVLIGIANHDGDGGSWPSVATLARYANVDSRSVQRALDKLERLGEVRRLQQAGGTQLTRDDRRPNLYQVLIRCPEDCDRTTQHRTRRQVERARPLPLMDEQIEQAAWAHISVATEFSTGVTPVSPRKGDGVTPVSPHGVTPVSPEPSLELTTHLSETNVSDRARESAAVWDDPRCPGDWKAATHELGRHGMCIHCHERPLARVTNITTGEAR